MLQPPPVKAHTGEGRDRVGPGAYELVGPGPFQRPTGTTWGASRAGRSLKFGSAVPGVGTYDLANSGPRRHGAGLLVTIGGVEVVFGGTTGTSSFVSKAPRPLQKGAELSPGPGEYTPPPPGAGGTGVAGMGLRNTAAVFGSTAARGSWEVDPTMTRAAPTYWQNPGPGAYEDPRASPVKAGAPGRGAPAGAGALAAAAAAASAPFTCSAARFGPSDNALPGPGDYHPDAVVSLEFEAFKKATGSRPSGAFGAGSGRFPGQRGASSPARQGVPAGILPEAGGGEAPGPGQYNPQVPSGSGRAGGRGGHSVFASRTGRFRPLTAPPAVPDFADYDGVSPVKGDPSRLGPGAYSPEKPSSKGQYSNSRSRTAPFGTDSGRTKLEAGVVTPGPGRYDPLAAVAATSAKPPSAPPPKAGFSTQADRFGAGGNKWVPGPGAYAGSADKGGLVRRSFNITYGSMG
ncbi:hypothetical protein HYH03_010281 [Edaphochlamys debaryana]|uniref:Uncharacterized protein n=1 Tax=Edaphochlamys debaryana TaxID=47281 RepID=A0A836BXK4_9CHLO|nr:hypothetical protein HYH03_010281 [Edaphochlamys debaryana]|eukprot:KAG2491274.1 hypothetical protein HYH03_010281 [Edaphochlamys debaryana]